MQFGVLLVIDPWIMFNWSYELLPEEVLHCSEGVYTGRELFVDLTDCTQQSRVSLFNGPDVVLLHIVLKN